MTTLGARTRCSRCNAQLRRDRPPGALCGPCERAGPDPRHDLPPDFYTRPLILAALTDYDFGALFLAIRAETGWTQQTLGEIIGLDREQISAIERGTRQLRDVRIAARVASRLLIPPGLLGFSDGATVGAGGAISGRKVVNWMDRRIFVQHVAGITLGMATASGLDAGRLLSLLPGAEPAGTRHIGADDVQVIDQLTTTFVRQDFAHGAGLVRDAAVAQLRTVLPLLDAQVSPEVRPRLMLATAFLASQAGWMSFQVGQDEAARRLWTVGLELARDTEDPRGADLASHILMNMTQQATHLGRLDEALQLARIGHAASTDRDPVSPSTNCNLASAQAFAFAAQGDLVSCDRALGQGEEHFTTIDPANRPPWGSFLNEVVLASDRGRARYTLASLDRDSRTAGRAASSLRYAADNWGPDYARLRATNLADLAGAHALAGDTDTAISVGHQAVDEVTVVHSVRAYDRLRVLNTVLEPLNNSAGVAELRERLAATAA
ncbi:MAG: helix-turn-helix transcriptional regulator [Pseudonocardiaceae bacterium]